MVRAEEKLVHPLIDLINQHFHMNVGWGENNIPVVSSATPREQDSLALFLNGVIRLVDQSGLPGTINYYFGHELDYETPEELHRY